MYLHPFFVPCTYVTPMYADSHHDMWYCTTSLHTHFLLFVPLFILFLSFSVVSCPQGVNNVSLVKCLFPGLDGFCSVGSGYVSTSSSTSVVCQARELVSLFLVLGFGTQVASSVVQSFLQLPNHIQFIQVINLNVVFLFIPLPYN